MDDFHVLTTDIDDRMDVGPDKAGAHGMTAQFAHLLVGNAFQRIAPVTGSQGKGHVFFFHVGIFQNFRNRTCGTGSSGPHVYQGFCHDLFSVFQDNALGCSRSNIDSQGIDTH